MVFEDGYIGAMRSRTCMASMLMFVSLVANTSASMEISGAKNMSRIRFLQYSEDPKPAVCPDDYVDATNGSAHFWDCGATCPGHYWTNACCSCACVFPREVAGQEPCGSPASQVMKIDFQQQSSSSISSGQSSSDAPPSEELEDKIKRLALLCSIVLCAAACITFCCTFALSYGIAKKRSRVHPKLPPSPKQFEIESPIQPGIAQCECTDKQEEQAKVMTPRSIQVAKKYGFHIGGGTVIRPILLSVKDLRSAARPRSLSPGRGNSNVQSPRRARSLSPHP